MMKKTAAYPFERFRLGEIADVVNGFGFPEYLQGKTNLPFPLVKVSDMNAPGAEVIVSLAANTVDRSILEQIGGKTYPAGTIIFPKVGGALLTNKKRILGVDAAFDNNVMGVVPRRADGEWLYYWLLKLDLKTLANTQALPSIRQSDIANLLIDVPPLPEQRRIAARLREQLAAVAQAAAAVQAQFDAASDLPAVQLRATYTQTAQLPTCRLGDLLQLRKEVVHPRDNPHGPAVFVGLEHVETLTGKRIGSVQVEMSQLTGRKPRFYAGDIVYGYLRPYLNKLWVAEFDGLCSVDQYVYEVNQAKADTAFIAWFMRSPVYLERAPIDTTPGQLPRIRTEEVASVEINLPPLREQRAIVARLQSELAQTTALKEALSARKQALDHLPAALLREAFAGRL
ncbi:MAG: restriction endonuclease subunit S [Verrucomicrobia bacterium]|jgi:type I restriction enzyme S subunit|nr:restriction endonuclease subunit S [Verrucomicrobiota bacterium]OQC66594.1 MAG: EcoKI restriction-modification system protein HsdS [Verrucomicrobia bacterium ADurb.Bin006]MDI9382048.1 restriction endonuclease subunit S [Verrucomicrobiota bacterium]NMD19350.1 hypothetical protein [Verrucomicrobiota bacterium]HOA61087.1 restriction endonuclease subunit S [Verrucomicrobiota bacterium]